MANTKQFTKRTARQEDSGHPARGWPEKERKTGMAANIAGHTLNRRTQEETANPKGNKRVVL